MSPRPLGQRELALLRLYSHCSLQMSPWDFYRKWSVTHSQIAQICGCSLSTVDRWFASGNNYHPPELKYLRRLAEMDALWESYEQIPPSLWHRLCPIPQSDFQDLSP